MKQASEMEWTDGTAKSLKVLASAIEKQEKGRHTSDEDYYSNPELMVMDMLTGSTVMLQTEPHTGGKTHGNGYRRCSAVTQRIPAKMKTKKMIGRLLKMSIRNFVLVDASSDEYSVVVAKAIKDIAAMLTDDSTWSVEDDKYADALQAAISDLMELTTSVRAGDSLLKVEAIPMSTAHMDVSKIVNKIKMEEEVVDEVIADA